jgi:soluble lytic murein transglycosylase
MLDKMSFVMLLGISPLSLASSLEQQRTLFLQAEQALNQGRPAEARQLADSLAGYPLQPYLLFEILSKVPGNEAEIPGFLDRYGRTRYADPLRKKWLDHLAQGEFWPDYVRYYRETEDTQARCNYYWALFQLDRSREAFAGAARLWATGEPTPSACDRLFAAWQATPEFTAEQIWRRFGAVLDKNRIDMASALRNLVSDQHRVQADTWLAVHDNPQLVEQCTPWNRQEPIFGRIFAHGIDRLARQDPLRALSVWNLRRGEFKISPEDQARTDRRLAMALATQHYPQAAAYLGTMPEDSADSQIRSWRVRSALFKQDWPVVLAALEQLDAAEKQQTAWRYWWARSLEALGGGTSAAEIYRQLAGERDFYGFMAADRLQRHYALASTPIPVADAEWQTLAGSEPFREVQEFRALDRPGEAQREWMHAIGNLPQKDLIVAAKLAQHWGWNRLAILTAVKAEYWDDLSLRFPLAYSQPVLQEARGQQLDPAVVFGLIRRESAFDPYAKSSAGALGLMQLLPGTGKQAAHKLNEAWQSEHRLLEPGLNVRYGSAYFRSLMNRFGNHLALAAAAYNAGPSRVDRWLPALKPMPADIWIETIPFNETRQYVGAVLSYAIIYRDRLGGPAARISGFLPDIAPGFNAQTRLDRPAPIPVCR